MEANRTNQTRNVRVRYVPGQYGLALSIDESLEEPAADQTDDQITDDQVNVQTAMGDDEGVLTVIQSGVTTLELRRREGSGPSMLIWDEAEVDWSALAS